MMGHLRYLYTLVRETFAGYSKDNCPRLAAALAFNVLLSLAPLLLLVIGIAGLFIENTAARGRLVCEFRDLVGDQGAQAVDTMLDSSKSTSGGVLATVFGVIVLVFAATGLVAQLKDALDAVWNVRQEANKGLGIWREVRTRLLSFSLILVLGFLLLVSLVAGAVLHGLGNWIDAHLFGGTTFGLAALNFLLSLALSTLLFAMVFKFLPSARVSWTSVWIGAVVTALLFNLGKFLIGLYLGQAAVGSSFGAAGSVVVLLVWVYYSTQLLLVGAEFTWVYDRHRTTRTAPATAPTSTPALAPA